MRMTLRHYNNGQDYGVRSEITSDLGAIGDRICIGEPIGYYDKQTSTGNYGNNGYVGVRIPIVYYYPTNGPDNSQLRVLIEFSKIEAPAGNQATLEIGHQ